MKEDVGDGAADESDGNVGSRTTSGCVKNVAGDWISGWRRHGYLSGRSKPIDAVFDGKRDLKSGVR